MIRILAVSYIFISVIFFSSCEMQTSDPFLRHQEAKRFTRDSFYRLSHDSPIPPDDRKYFMNLNYFEPKKEYVVRAEFRELDTPQSVVIQDSEGMDQNFYRIGKLYFTLQGKACTLSVFQDAEYIKDSTIRTLFLPFYDETNGKETYASGRYLDVKYVKGMKEVELDFNDAYNPFCVYTDYYKCPVPPIENRLPFRVEAGEMNFMTEEK